MTWRIIAAIQKGTPVLNCGTELSGQLVLLFPKNERWATEYFEILSHFFIYYGIHPWHLQGFALNCFANLNAFLYKIKNNYYLALVQLTSHILLG